jgi:hypothetical protein
VILFTDGEERLREKEGTGEGEVARKGASQATAEAVREKGGALSRVEMLRHRIRLFVDGPAIGTREFRDEVFREAPERFGPRRRSGARKIRGCDTPLHALRDLKDGVD